jgi:hypothetical protein
MTTLLDTAQALAAAGISVIPVRADGTKQPAVPWKRYQSEIAGPAQITEWFAPGGYTGMGAVTGAVSGNLELTEIEGRAAAGIPAVAQLAADTGLGDLWGRLCTGWLEHSPGGGWHWFYRVDFPAGTTPPGNTKIASRPSNPGELAENPQAKLQVLAETRAEGGYVVAAPSNGTCHPSGKPWTRVVGGPDTAPLITPEERDAFHALLATLHEAAPAPAPETPRTSYPAGEPATGSPGDDYERQTDWADLLLPAGWTLVGTDGEERRWRRPGKGLGQSATTGYAGDRDRLYVFTSSTEFEQNRPYTKFGAFALLHHGGDHSAAAAALRRGGYGDPAAAPAPRLKPFTAGGVEGNLATVHQLPAPAEDPRAARTVELTPADGIKPRRVRWLWDGRLALGTLGLLAGRQGLGKSTLAYWIAAQISTGALPGEYQGTPRAVFICATEDSWEYTIVPRLIAHGADRTRVFRTDAITADAIHVPLTLPRDISALERAATEQEAALLILDPLTSRLGDLDTHRDAEVRMALEPLVAAAERARMAVLGLIHHNKSGGGDPLQSVMGSTAFSAVARSVHTVVPDPDDDTDRKRLFGTPKNNLGRSDLPTLEFTVESYAVPTEDDGPAWTGCINWLGEHEGSIADAMEQAQDGDRSAVHEASDWLQDYMASEGGSAPSADIKREGAKAGHSYDALKRARKKLHLVYRNTGFPRRSFWFFPGPAVTQWEQSRQSEQEQPTDPTAVGVARVGRDLTALTTTTAPTEGVGAVGAVGQSAGVLARATPLERCPLHFTPHPGCYTCDTLAAETDPQ